AHTVYTPPLPQHLPVVGQRLEIGKAADVDEGPLRHGGEVVHERVVRRHERRVVRDLAIELQAHVAAEVHEPRRGEKKIEDRRLPGQQTCEHGRHFTASRGYGATSLQQPSSDDVPNTTVRGGAE